MKIGKLTVVVLGTAWLAGMTGMASSLLVSSVGHAQQAPSLTPPFKTTPLLKSSVSGDPNKEAVMISVEWPAHATTGRHAHPGDEYATVLEGELLTRADGGEWRTIRAGQAYHQLAGVIHETKAGEKPARSIGVLVVEKGKPIMQPAQPAAK